MALMADIVFDLYRSQSTRPKMPVPLPGFEQRASQDDPEGYLPSPALQDAVNVALLLGMPLLVTGEPGTGKTQLAWSIAHKLGLPDPLVFHTKTTSTATDLFYRYDALSHFRASQPGAVRPSAHDFIRYEPLGEAILRADPEVFMNTSGRRSHNRPSSAPELPPPYGDEAPRRSVVLVDEVDKAPRDLPNDILHEIEKLELTVWEVEHRPTYRANPAFRPVVVLTSNSERALPDAFLRRCIYFHISFPDGSQLKAIVQSRLKSAPSFLDQTLEQALQLFLDIRREAGLDKSPATAELIDWVRLLQLRQIDANKGEALSVTLGALAKGKDDSDRLRDYLMRRLPGSARTPDG
jgi:MoxR-like ATPase